MSYFCSQTDRKWDERTKGIHWPEIRLWEKLPPIWRRNLSGVPGDHDEYGSWWADTKYPSLYNQLNQPTWTERDHAHSVQLLTTEQVRW